MKVLISGNIIGLDKDIAKNSFEQAENTLMAEGHVTHNPFATWSNDLSCEDFIMSQIKVLFISDAIYLLNNWQACKESIILKTIAELHGKRLVFQPSENEIAVFTDIEEAIHRATGLHRWQYAVRSRNRELFYRRMIFAHHADHAGMDHDIIAPRIVRDRSTVAYYVEHYPVEREVNKEFAKYAHDVEIILQKSVSQ